MTAKARNNSVCIISGHYPPKVCGIGDYVWRLARALTDDGDDITVITSDANPSEPWPVLGAGLEWNRQTLRSVIRLVRQIDPGVVDVQYQLGIYGNSAAVCCLPLMLKVFTKAHVVTTFHDLNGPQNWGRLNRLGVLLALCGSHAAIVCSNKQHSGLKRIPRLGNRVRKIPVGPTLNVAEGPGSPLEKIEGCIDVVCHGFVWRNRGLESVISACAEAAKRGHKLRLVFAGEVAESDYPGELRAMAQDKGLTKDGIIFTDTLAEREMSLALRSADIAVLPYPTGVSTGRSTFANAAIHGLPIITTYDPANCPEELRDGENVLLYEPENDKKLAECIERLCLNVALREKLSDNIVQAVRDWQWSSIAEQHRKVYGRGDKDG